MARLAEALEKPDEGDAAASAIRGLIERIVLTPDADGLHVTLKGDFGAILEWTGNGDKKEVTDTPGLGMSASVVGSVGAIPETLARAPRRPSNRPLKPERDKSQLRACYP